MADVPEPAKPFPYGHLLYELTRTEVLMRDQGTVLGFLWTLLHPALMFAVLYALFVKWMGKFVDTYAVYLLVGIVLWNFFQKSTSYALGSFRRMRGTVLNYRFPREIVVFSAVGAVLWSSAMEFCVLVPVLLALGQAPHWTWLLLPGVFALELLLATALSLFLAICAVEFEDLERIWDVLTSAMFYLTPVFYPLSILSPRYQELMRLNPLMQILRMFRDCVIAGKPPAAGVVLALLAIGLAGVAAGRALLRRLEYRLADKLAV
ncbi:MAG: ABC transporter permease [Elusimicrobia bacterium]|nr:ABC transporter permease [Elusimicrobiota bacterium]